MSGISVIIPVLNNWQYTRKCLKSIARFTCHESLEIILLDNASTDSTQNAAPFLGRQLFGDNFVYCRNEKNINFAGACNQGARLAKGEYLIFLNNDTEVQEGWLDPLIEDFEKYPQIAGTGPILLYPHNTPLGTLAQHLGVYVTPLHSVGHLYSGIPSICPLVKKRRFFQAITAACLVMPKMLFLNYGMFDEKYKNGFEDMDLCARLGEKGFQFTVNPDSMIFHFESMTPGRGRCELENLRLWTKKAPSLKPNWAALVADDGMELTVTDWLTFQPELSVSTSNQLNAQINEASQIKLELLQNYPYWRQGWQVCLNETLDMALKASLFKIYNNLFLTPESAFEAIALAGETGRFEMFAKNLAFLANFLFSPEYYMLARQKDIKILDQDNKLIKEGARYDENYKKFILFKYIPLLEKLLQLLTKYEKGLWPHNEYKKDFDKNFSKMVDVRKLLEKYDNYLKEAKTII